MFVMSFQPHCNRFQHCTVQLRRAVFWIHLRFFTAGPLLGLSPQCAFRHCFLSFQFVRPWKSALETALFSAWTSHTSPSCCRNWASQRAKALRWSWKWIFGESGQWVPRQESSCQELGSWFTFLLQHMVCNCGCSNTLPTMVVTVCHNLQHCIHLACFRFSQRIVF